MSATDAPVILPLLTELVLARLDERGRAWLEEARERVVSGVTDEQFALLFSSASRFASGGSSRKAEIEPSEGARAQARERMRGLELERWKVLECARVVLLLSRPDLAEPSAELAIEELFRFADEGELCAGYRALAHLPAPERFVWRAGEGCRTNMLTVFEAVACDTPFPATQFDDLAFRQAVIKGIFVGAPVWRIWGLDRRQDAELARMALDLVEERRSAGREVQPELWLCLGAHAGERGLEAMEQELESAHVLGRKAAALALARAGELERLRGCALLEAEPEVVELMRATLARCAAGEQIYQTAFRELDPRLQTC